ncbi:esterase lipase thioesterase [Curvularia clavata]|uniref:Esterase lipase thioesterase n=1 Tax=Curvularia clavata TaxID=95742 RepID=A0A9Q8Z4F9_CURCL|nr:esterase lipase thioesterase [Curvularia clavata]
MDGTPSPDSHAIHPQLRQRMLNRAATVAEGAQPSTPPAAVSRRRSSLVSDLSDTRNSFWSSTDNLAKNSGKNDRDRLAVSDEPSQWIALPVVAAVVPAIIGLTVENGAVIATDVLILVLAGWFLHWSVKVPWDWYRDAQQRRYINDEDDETYDDTIHEADEDSVEGIVQTVTDTAAELGAEGSPMPRMVSTVHEEARKALRRSELLAFVGCFLGPLCGALLMHTIRGQLMRAEGIVSDANLSIFLLIAEIPPVNRLIKMRTERILHLQRIVREAPREPIQLADAQQLAQRMAELESRLDSASSSPKNNNGQIDVDKISADIRQTTQLQLDALNRAVRRYEKRHMAQSLQIEARFQDLEARLQDTLALAAAAARTGHRPGIITVAFCWIAGTISNMLQLAWDISMYPFRTAMVALSVAKSMFVRDEQQAKRRPKGGQVNGYTSMPSSRIAPKPGR